MKEIYARYDGSKKQMLHEHLSGTEKKIAKIISSKPVKHVVQRLASGADVNIDDVTRAAKTAALFHDLGKAAHHYQKQRSDVCEGRRRSIGFSLHEVVSANLYTLACLKHRKITCQHPFKQPWLTGLTMQAVILHHQGLRPTTIEMLYSNELSIVLDNDPSKSAQNLQAVIQEVEKNNVSYEPAKTLLSITKRDASSMVATFKPDDLERLYNLDAPTQIQLSRVVTACLMIADCWDVYEAVGGRTSSYLQEITVEYLKTLGLRNLTCAKP